MSLGKFEDVEADWKRFAELGRHPVIALVGCGASKGVEPAPACELYTGDLFRKSVAYAEKVADRVLVLSGRWGLVSLDYVLEPYEYKLQSADVKHWSHGVVNCYLGLDSRFCSGWAPRSSPEEARVGVGIPGELIILADREYADPIAARLVGIPRIKVSRPLDGMQIGERLAWLKRALAEAA
jgi:hypothetical protein